MADPNNSALEDARKRARRRLVGAVVLALAAAVVLPMFLESDPKPLGAGVQIQIPAIDDAKFQNRLTPGAARAPAADKVMPAAASEPAKAPVESTDKAALPVPATMPVATEPAVRKPEAPASVPAPAAPVAPAETKATTTARASAPASPVATSSPRKPAVPASSTGAESPAAVPSPATSSPAAAPVTKSSAPILEPPKAAGSAVAGATAPPAPAVAPAVADDQLRAAAVSTAKAAPPAVPSAKPGEYVVQLGAFVDSVVASELAAKASAQGFPAFLEGVTTQGGPVQRVRVGPFATRSEADAAAARLKAAGFTAVARAR